MSYIHIIMGRKWLTIVQKSKGNLHSKVPKLSTTEGDRRSTVSETDCHKQILPEI